jgi:hypothetical protein
MALNGPLQGHLIGVTTFTNSGIIDLQSNPAAGDVLVITGSRTAGVAGPGTFITGGTLKLDTVLNQGGAATRSDTLVVDGTLVGTGGATSMAIRNAGGTGALTVGDGILVVQVLDPARSAGGAFMLANQELRAGDFDYRLFHGGIGGSNPGDWFLRNEFVVGPPIEPPGGALCFHPTRRRLRCRQEASFRSSGRRSRPTASCNRSPGNWGLRSSARSTTGSATPTSQMVASLRLRPQRSLQGYLKKAGKKL